MIFSSNTLLIFACIGLLFFVASIFFRFYRLGMDKNQIGIRNYRSLLSGKERILLFGLSSLFFVMGVLFYSFQSSSEMSSASHNVLFCIDVSKSMRVQDVQNGDSAPLSRMEAAANLAASIIEVFPQNSYGVVIFAKTATLVSPLTQVHEYTKDTLSSLASQKIEQ